MALELNSKSSCDWQISIGCRKTVSGDKVNGTKVTWPHISDCQADHRDLV